MAAVLYQLQPRSHNYRNSFNIQKALLVHNEFSEYYFL